MVCVCCVGACVGCACWVVCLELRPPPLPRRDQSGEWGSPAACGAPPTSPVASATRSQPPRKNARSVGGQLPTSGPDVRSSGGGGRGGVKEGTLYGLDPNTTRHRLSPHQASLVKPGAKKTFAPRSRAPTRVSGLHTCTPSGVFREPLHSTSPPRPHLCAPPRLSASARARLACRRPRPRSRRRLPKPCTCASPFGCAAPRVPVGAP